MINLSQLFYADDAPIREPFGLERIYVAGVIEQLCAPYGKADTITASEGCDND